MEDKRKMDIGRRWIVDDCGSLRQVFLRQSARGKH